MGWTQDGGGRIPHEPGFGRVKKNPARPKAAGLSHRSSMGGHASEANYGAFHPPDHIVLIFSAAGGGARMGPTKKGERHVF